MNRAARAVKKTAGGKQPSAAKCVYMAALILCAVFLMSACDSIVETSGPAQNPNGEVAKAPLKEVKLPYDKGAGFDPNTTTSRYNLELCALLYEPLVELADGMKPQGGLAKDIKVSGSTVTLSLSKPLAADVVSILGKMRSGGNYAVRLANVISIETTGDFTVIITLLEPDASFAANLNIPMTCAVGKYTLSDDKLLAAGDEILREIQLVHVQNDEEAAFAYRSGDLTAVTGMTGLRGKEYATNNLVYIGTTLRDVSLRKAVSAALNRPELIDDSLAVLGYVSLSPVHPDWYLYSSDIVARGYDANYAKESLAGRTPKLRLLVCSDSSDKLNMAQSVAFQLKAASIDVQILEYTRTAYMAALESGGFDLYLGEVKIKPDMDLSALCHSAGVLNYGRLSISSVDAAFDAYKSRGTAEAAVEIIRALDDECPIIPLYYVIKEVAAPQQVLDVLTPTAANPFCGIENVHTQ